MSLVDAHQLPLQGRIVAFDLGEVRIGVAVSDPGQVLASPFETLTVPRYDDDALVGALERAADRHAAEAVVIGLPRRMDGRQGSAAQRATKIATGLARRSAVPVALWDERLTTVEAQRQLIEADTRASHRREVIDQVAASVILQAVLEAQRQRRGEASQVTPSAGATTEQEIK